MLEGVIMSLEQSDSQEVTEIKELLRLQHQTYQGSSTDQPAEKGLAVLWEVESDCKNDEDIAETVGD